MIYLFRHLTSLWQNTTVREKSALAGLVIVFLASATISLAAYVGRHTMLIPEPGGIYREAAVGQPRYLNPILASASDLDLDITRLVYSSLFKLNQNLELENDLASSYEAASDQKTYTVHLKSGLTWHDGTPFTADDVVFTIRSIQTPDYASPLQSSFQGVEVEKIDDATVKFTLEQPYALFLNNLTVGIAPEHVWAAIPPKNVSLTEQVLKPVGTGPFKFSEITTRRKTGDITSLKLARSDTYYLDRPYLDEILFMFYPTHEEASQALLANQVDGVSFLPLQLADSLKWRASYVIQHLLIPQYFALFFNQNKNDILADAGIRSSLALAIDRETIVKDALHGEADVLQLPIPPGVFNFQEQFQAPAYNPEAAKQNLEDAGWKDSDSDGIREKDNKRLHLKITTTDWPEYIRTAELVQQQWLQIGVETEIESLGAGTIQQTAVRPRDYEVLLFGEILPAQPDPYPFWHSTQTRSPGLNLALFKDQTVDKLLEEARKEPDAGKRRETYLAFQQKILDLNPAIILYRPYYLFTQKSKVHGVDIHYGDLPASRFNRVEKWHVRTKRVWK